MRRSRLQRAAGRLCGTVSPRRFHAALRKRLVGAQEAVGRRHAAG